MTSPRSWAWRPPASFLATAALSLVFTLATYLTYTSLPSTLSLSQQCRMSRMWPSYEPHTPPSPSSIGSKYNLYLYRENPPGGPTHSASSRPVLFVHGNAGSYGQVRSVGNWAWIQYQAEKKAVGEANAHELDWWTVDFNEDFSAFHAGTLEAQSVYLNEVLEFLVKRYGLAEEDVPVLAHSMGGIVARLALVQENHPRTLSGAARIKTLVTLSTPHAIPPAPIERGIQQIYNRINVPTNDLLIVSLSGGLLDTQLPSEYATLPSPALQIFTTNLPTLWSSVDHLAMMWCDQLRRKVLRGFWAAKSLAFNATLQDRRDVWRDALDSPDASEEAQFQRFMQGLPVVDGQPDGHSFDVPLNSTSTFRLLTSHKEQDLQVRLCKGTSPALSCSPIPHWAYALVPASPTSHTWKDFPQADVYYDANGPATLRELRLTSGHLRSAGWTSIRIVAAGQPAWWRAGWDSSAPTQTYHLPHVDSSLVQYSFTLRSHCAREQQPMFAPMAHVYNAATGDGRWYTSLKFEAEGAATLPVYIHATSPYLSTPSGGLTVDIYTDSVACPDGVEILDVKPDLTRSVGHLVSRYRVGVAAWPFVAWSFVGMKWINGGDTSALTNTLQVKTLSATIALVVLSVLQQLLSSYPIAHDALFGLTRQSLRPFGFIYNDWILTVALGLIAIMLGHTILATYVLLIEAGTSATSYLLRPISTTLQFEHVDTKTRPKWRLSTTLTIVATLAAVKLYIPYQFVYLSLTLLQILNVVRSRLSVSTTRQQQNTFLATHLFLLLPQQAPSLLVFIRNFIAALQSSRSTYTHVAAGRSFHAQYSSDHALYKIIPVLLLVQILSTGRTLLIPRMGVMPLKGVLACQALYALVYGIRHPYGLYDISLLFFTALVLGHYACRLGWVDAPATRMERRRSEEGMGLLQRGKDDPAGSGVAIPFSIPDEVGHAGSVDGREDRGLTGRGAEHAQAVDQGVETETTSTDGVTEESEDDSADQNGNTVASVADIPEQKENAASQVGKAATSVDNEAYEIDDTPKRSAQVASQSTQALDNTNSTTDLTTLLTTYLRTLDAYTKQRDRLSTTLSSSFFALSADRMATGGWGANVRKELGSALLRREIEVRVDDSGEDKGVGCSNWRLDPVPLPYIDEEEQKETLLSERKAASGVTTGSSGLRRRRQGADGDDDNDNDERLPSQSDDEKKDSHSHNEKASHSQDDKETPPTRRRYPSALQQYSALPSANLRKAQQGFKDVLAIAAGGGEINLIQLQMQLTALEERIRHVRKAKRASQ